MRLEMKIMRMMSRILSWCFVSPSRLPFRSSAAFRANSPTSRKRWRIFLESSLMCWVEGFWDLSESA